MKVTIVIPTLNSLVIDQTLSSVEAQKFYQNDFRIIVVGRDDPHLIHSSDKIYFDCTESPYSPAKARNRGAAQAQSEVIVFLDSDCIAPPGWLSKLVSPLEKAKFAGVGGGVNFRTDNYWTLADNLSIFHEFLYTKPAGIRRQLPSLNCAIRRTIFEKVGGFDEAYPKPAGEDFDLFYRINKLGENLYFEPQAWIQHIPSRTSYRDLIRHAATIGKFTTKLKPEYSNNLGFPRFLRNKWSLRFLSPLLAFAATARVFNTSYTRKYFYTFPAVYASKVAWCMGAARSHYLQK